MAFLDEPEPVRFVPMQVAPAIRRLVAPNPGPMTHHGTNTWLVDGPEGITVIDPGPDDAAHRAAILAAGTVTHILLTHTHADHLAGAPALRAATGAPVAGWAKPWDGGFVPDVKLADGDIVAGLLVVHTPGARQRPCVLRPAWHGRAVQRRPRDVLVHQHRQPARRRHGGLHGEPAPAAGARRPAVSVRPWPAAAGPGAAGARDAEPSRGGGRRRCWPRWGVGRPRRTGWWRRCMPGWRSTCCRRLGAACWRTWSSWGGRVGRWRNLGVRGG